MKRSSLMKVRSDLILLLAFVAMIEFAPCFPGGASLLVRTAQLANFQSPSFFVADFFPPQMLWKPIQCPVEPLKRRTRRRLPHPDAQQPHRHLPPLLLRIRSPLDSSLACFRRERRQRQKRTRRRRRLQLLALARAALQTTTMMLRPSPSSSLVYGHFPLKIELTLIMNLPLMTYFACR